MAADHVGEGIRVNCVCPGTADTPWVGRLLDAADDPEAERAALERPPADGPPRQRPGGRRRDRLPGDRGRRSTGTALFVDGGMQNLRLRKPSGASLTLSRTRCARLSSAMTLRRRKRPALASLDEGLAALVRTRRGRG